MLAGVAVVLLVIVGVGAWLVVSSPMIRQSVGIESPFKVAKDACAPSSDYAIVGDGGRSFEVQTAGNEQAGLSFEDLQCIWRSLKVPDSVIAEIKSTRALDGKQTGDWGNMHASWTYHPDQGLHMIFTLR